jgi:LacI family transcriptional regulator
MSGKRSIQPKRPTMRDVGLRAGVSFKTVSRVVNGEGSVSADLAERVNAAIAELGYRPDNAASTLRRSDRRTRTLGVVLEDLANPFSSEVHRAVVDIARARGVLVLAASSDEDPDDERDGGPALVTVDRPAAGLDADAVLSDNRAGAVRATNHLLRRGHRRIGYLGDLHTIHTAAERHAGHLEALAVAGVEMDPALVRQDVRDSASAEATVIELLTGPAPPTAIFASQNLLTVGAVRALRGLDLHRRVALVGFDDVVLAELLEPGITVVAQDPGRMGAEAAELLLARIEGHAGPPRVREVPTRLIPRGSGELAPDAA